MTQIILASSSETRKALLNRLHLDYLAISPEIDESAKPHESAEQLAQRLSFEKALKVANDYPDAIVIGSDQVAYLAQSPQQFIGKPYTKENAIAQLQNQSGKVLHFATGLSVQCINQQFEHTCIVPFQAKFRDLSNDEIQRYVTIDQPLHCAGSFKGESLGISLFEWLKGDDYTALMGLPIIQLCAVLRQLGVRAP